MLAVDCTELALLASKVTSLPEGSPIQPTIVEVCVYADTKKDASGVCIALDLSGRPIPAPVLMRCLISINRKCLKAQEVRLNVTSVVKKHNLLEQIFIH
ncbi:hypothetical protein OkiPb00165_28170 [Escherichia coli]